MTVQIKFQIHGKILGPATSVLVKTRVADEGRSILIDPHKGIFVYPQQNFLVVQFFFEPKFKGCCLFDDKKGGNYNEGDKNQDNRDFNCLFPIAAPSLS